MRCWHCNTELIWGGDHDVEDHEEFMMVTNLSCPECKSFVEVYLPHESASGRSKVCPICAGEGHVIAEVISLSHTGDRFAFPSTYEIDTVCPECGGVGSIQLDS